ncbi:MAG: hypothetical protein AAGD43_07960 [Pseudomonadota bacterium]
MDNLKEALWSFAADSKVLFGLLALVVLGLLWVITSDDALALLSAAAGEARVLAAIIIAIGTVTGVVLSAVVGLVKDWQADRSERIRLATALLHEIYGHADMIAACGSLANAKVQHDQLLTHGEMIRFEPPKPLVYPAVVEKITLFPHMDAGSIVAFYGSMETAKQITHILPDRQPEAGDQKQFVANQANMARDRSAMAWRGAATNTVKAIKSLQPYSRESSAGEGKEKLDSLMEELAEVSINHGSPRFKE